MRTDAQVFDLLTLGLTWVQEKAPKLRGWTGNGILKTISSTKALEDRQYRDISQDPAKSLTTYTMQRSHLVWPGDDSLRARRKLVEESDKLLVVIINTGMYFSEKLVASKGYLLLATKHGQEHARRVAPGYAAELTSELFLEGWKQHCRQMSRLHVTQPWTDR
jgi:hypothetical protein